MYKSTEEYDIDITYTSFLNNETLPKLIDFYDDKEVDCSNPLVAVPEIKGIAKEARDMLQAPEDSTAINKITLK